MIHPASVAARRLGSRPGCFRIIDEPPGLVGRSAPNSGRTTPATDPRVKSYMARSSGLVNVPDPQVSSPPRYPVLRRMCRRQEAHWLFKPSTASPPRNRRRIRLRHLELTVQRLPCRHNRCASRTQRIRRIDTPMSPKPNAKPPRYAILRRMCQRQEAHRSAPGDPAAPQTDPIHPLGPASPRPIGPTAHGTTTHGRR